jgi:uncharacterized protein YbjT (DUF2867 family)
MILVTGATGQIGRHLVQELRTRKISFRAMVRHESARAALETKGIKTVPGDFNQPSTFVPALAGVKEVFLLTTPSPDQVLLEGEFLAAAVKAGVHRVVRLSAMGANPHSASPLLQLHGLCETQVQDSGIDWTILRPTMFMQNLAPMYGATVSATSTFYAPAGDACIPLVDTRDVAAVAATVLAGKGHEWLTYEITGPDAHTYAGIAEILGVLLGRGIQFVDVPDDAAYKSMTDMGMTGWFAHCIITLFHYFRANGGTALALGTVPRLTGRPARTLTAYLQENLEAFRKPGSTAPATGYKVAEVPVKKT